MSRNRLLASMDSLAKKRQKEFDENAKWTNQIRYYKSWDTHNNKYQNWTSSECYKNSIDQYDSIKMVEMKKNNLEQRREKLRKLFFEEAQEYDLEIQCSPRYGRSSHHYKVNETPTEVLKEVNIGLKLAEDDRRRHEAELKLYHQWKNENPIIRNFENNQNKSDLKLAWLDQQIEKKMREEKQQEEMKKMIAEREELLKKEKVLDEQELQEKSEKEKQYMTEIQLQIQLFNLKEEEASKLKTQEEEVVKKKSEINDLIAKNLHEIGLRKNKETALYNCNQAKVKLRKKALLIKEQLEKDQQLVQEILASKTAEEIANESKRQQTISSIFSFLNYIQTQRRLEDQREKYISFIFDSEARSIWEKQERQWSEEQQTRDRLLKDTLLGIQQQIDFKLQDNLEKQRQLLREREEMLLKIEEHDKQMKIDLEELAQKRVERKLELDKQVDEKKVLEFERKMKEEQKKKDELEEIRKQEERLKQELMRMQTRNYPATRYNRRIIW